MRIFFVRFIKSYFCIIASLCGYSSALCSCFHASHFLLFIVVCMCSRPVDDGDYDDDLADEESNHAINDLSSGRVMTCTGLVEMPKYVPRGRTLNCADVCVSVPRR